MDNKNIATFVRVAEFNHFTKAAASLGYSQAAVTAQIKTLERELGVPLFDRIGKHVRLTQAGKTFLPHALDLLKAEETAIHSVRPSDTPAGELHICSASSYASQVLPKVLLPYHQQCPNVQVTVKLSDYLEDTTHKLARGEIDFLLCLEEEDMYPEFRTVAKRPEPLVFVTHPGNPLAARAQVRLADIAADQLILSDRDIGYGALLEKALRKRGIDVQPVMEIGSADSIVSLLCGGYGTTYLPLFMVERQIASGTLVQLEVEDPGIELYAYFLCSRERWINPAMQAFIQMVRAELMPA